MIVDTSAILAIFFQEEEEELFSTAIANCTVKNVSTCRMSTSNLLESYIVVESRDGNMAGDELDVMLKVLKIKFEPVDDEQVRVAHEAWRRFGKGNHPASLNYGDCFAYALSKTTKEPLLFKGNDFAQTDIEAAKY